MDLKHFSHEHPLKFNEETSHEGDEKAYCSGCGELVSGPSFSCAACKFYLDKQCAEAPKRLNHPFHSKHSFHLLKRRPKSYSGGNAICDFCDKSCDNFLYHCSCKLDLHVKCALFSYNLVEKGVGELQHIAHIDPLISSENHNEQLKDADCLVCSRPLLDSVYFSPNCGFYLHVKCADLPSEVNHLFHTGGPLTLNCIGQGFSCNICKQKQSRGFFYQCSFGEFSLDVECATLATTIHHPCHRKHPLNLQFMERNLLCQICQQTAYEVYAYCCSICNLALHIECAPTPKVVKDKSHQHHFNSFWRLNAPFVCDACGTQGSLLSYICSTCSIMVHKKCISLPSTLNHPMHPEHPIFHDYLLEQDQGEIEMWDCQICHQDELNAKYARYHCSTCNYNVHVNCAIEDYKWYHFDESGKIDEENSASLLPYSVIKETNEGENVVATEIKHFSHEHNITLSNDIKDDKYCDGCVQCIFTSYYDCSQCNFSLHKSCAESPMKKRLWFKRYQNLVSLTSGCVFTCSSCDNSNSGFAYVSDIDNYRYCLRCALESPRGYKCEGHQHLLCFYKNYEGLCNACGDSETTPYRCKGCNFSLHEECMKLPLKARHRSDEHPLMLTYHDDNDYSESHYCDICEEERNPNQWFYHCATCDTSAHRECALGPYPFIKLGSIYKQWNGHPHPLTFVQKDYYYPECNLCGKPCRSLALECKEVECNGYIVSWECVKSKLQEEEEEDDEEGKDAKDEENEEDTEEEEGEDAEDKENAEDTEDTEEEEDDEGEDAEAEVNEEETEEVEE